MKIKFTKEGVVIEKTVNLPWVGEKVLTERLSYESIQKKGLKLFLKSSTSLSIMPIKENGWLGVEFEVEDSNITTPSPKVEATFLERFEYLSSTTTSKKRIEFDVLKRKGHYWLLSKNARSGKPRPGISERDYEEIMTKVRELPMPQLYLQLKDSLEKKMKKSISKRKFEAWMLVALARGEIKTKLKERETLINLA